MNSEPVIVEQTYAVPVAVVWNAITTTNEMRQWFFEPMTEFKPEPGFETRFTVRFEEQAYIHLWEILDVEPLKRIVYRWRYEGIPGDSTVVWELSETPDGTRLTLTNTILEPFPADNPIFSRESGVAGWTYLVQDSLKRFLES